MKIYRCIVLCCFTLMVLSSLLAAQDRKEDRKALREMMITVVRAVNESNFDALKPVLYKDLHITMVDQTPVKNLEEIKAFFHRLTQSEDSIISSMRLDPKPDIPTQFLTPTLATNHGVSKDTYTLKDGSTVTLNSRWSGIWIKDGGQWKITRLHAGVNFLDNQVMTAVESQKTLYGVGGVVLGLVVGGGLMFFFRRRRA